MVALSKIFPQWSPQYIEELDAQTATELILVHNDMFSEKGQSEAPRTSSNRDGRWTEAQWYRLLGQFTEANNKVKGPVQKTK